MNKLFLFILLMLILIASCSREMKLSASDYEWMPYKGNETLIFTSNKGDFDSVFFLKKDTLWGFPDAQSIFAPQCEGVRIFCRHTDSVIQDKSIRYLENDFCSIQKSKNGHTVLKVNLLTKDAVFYRLGPINLDSLNKVTPIVLETKKNRYKDVFVINGEDYSGYFRDRYDFVTKIYWSKSKGLIRFDKKKKAYWELTN